MKKSNSIYVCLALCVAPYIANAGECETGSNPTNIGDFVVNINVISDTNSAFEIQVAAPRILAMSMAGNAYTMTSRVAGLYDGPNGFISEAYDRLAADINSSVHGPLSAGTYQLYLSTNVTLPHAFQGTKQIGQGVFVCIELDEGESLEDALDDAEIDEWGLPSDPDRLHQAEATYCDQSGNCLEIVAEHNEGYGVGIEINIIYGFTFSCSGNNCTLTGHIVSIQVMNSDGSNYTGPSVQELFDGTTAGPSTQS